MKSLVSDFEYPLATGLRVLADPFDEVALSGGTGVVNPLMRPAPVPSSTPNGSRTMATVTLCCVVLLSSVGCDPKEDSSKEQGEGSRSSDMAGCQ